MGDSGKNLSQSKAWHLPAPAQHPLVFVWPEEGGCSTPGLTSSSGSSLSSGSELESSPMRKGVGEHTMSIMAGGSTGM